MDDQVIVSRGNLKVQIAGSHQSIPDGVVISRNSAGQLFHSEILILSPPYSSDRFALFGEACLELWIEAHKETRPDMETIALCFQPALFAGRYTAGERFFAPGCGPDDMEERPSEVAQQHKKRSYKRPVANDDEPPALPDNSRRIANLQDRLDRVREKMQANDQQTERYSGHRTNPANDVGGIRSRSRRQKRQLWDKWDRLAKECVDLAAQEAALMREIRALEQEPARIMQEWEVNQYIKHNAKPGMFAHAGFYREPLEIVRVNRKTVTLRTPGGGTERYLFSQVALAGSGNGKR